jgi:hypothetical protein
MEHYAAVQRAPLHVVTGIAAEAQRKARAVNAPLLALLWGDRKTPF